MRLRWVRGQLLPDETVRLTVLNEELNATVIVLGLRYRPQNPPDAILAVNTELHPGAFIFTVDSPPHGTITIGPRRFACPQ